MTKLRIHGLRRTALEFGQGFATRAEAVAWVADNAPDDGVVITAAGLSYVAESASTAISDMPGWEPFGRAYPDHFKDNATPGTTDMGAALVSAKNFDDRVCLKSATYLSTIQISLNSNEWIEGNGREKSAIEFTSAVPITDSAIIMRRRARLSSLEIRYASGVIAGTETAGQRVLLELDNAAGDSVTKGAVPLSDVKFGDAGTVIYSDLAETPFNWRMENIFIGDFSYRAFDFSSGTGFEISNLYIEGGLTWTCENVFNLRPATSKGHSLMTCSIGQMNIHQVKCNGHMVQIDRADSMTIAAMHTEATQLSGNNTAFLWANRSNIVIQNWSFLHSAIQGSDCSLFELDDGGTYGNAGAGSPGISRIVVENLLPRGVNNPNKGLFPGYVDGVDKTTGWKWARRTSGATGEYKLVFGGVEYLIYPGDVSTDETRIYNGIASLSDPDVQVIHAAPKKNFILNPGMDTWAASSSSTDGAEVATDWFVKSTGGTITASRDLLTWRGALLPALRANNTSTAAAIQWVYFKGYNPWELMDQNLVLSFVGKAANTGRNFYDVTVQVYDGSGGSVSTRIAMGSVEEFNFSTTAKRHSITFAGPDSTGLTWGASPYFELRFRLAETSNVYTGDFSISRVKLEAGDIATLTEELT